MQLQAGCMRFEGVRAQRAVPPQARRVAAVEGVDPQRYCRRDTHLVGDAEEVARPCVRQLRQQRSKHREHLCVVPGVGWWMHV